jgi:hypothetical protein
MALKVAVTNKLVNAPGFNAPEFGTWGVSDQYVVLDSFEKVENSEISKGELIFNFGVKQPTANQIIGINAELANIIEVEISPFYLPSIPLLPYITNDAEDDTMTPLIVPDPTLPRLSINTAPPEQITLIGSSQSMACFGGRLAVEFKDCDTQSIIGLNGTRFHFEMQAELSTFLNNVIVTPVKSAWDRFVFTEPHSSLTKLTVNIKNPDDGIFLPPDVLYNVDPIISQNSSGQPVLAFRITRQNHDILTNDRIFIRYIDLTNGMNDPIFRNIDKWLNSVDGHLVGMEGTTVVDKNYLASNQVVTTEIRLNPDLNLYDVTQSNPARYSVGTVLSSASRVNICIAKNRIRIPLRFRKVLNKFTNYKSA